MRTGADRDERRQQREVLKTMYPDYDARKHDVFVIRYNRELEEKALREWMKRRGVK